jgi:predicted alpha/beta hydrolase family esterase
MWVQFRHGDYSPAEDEVIFADSQARGTVRGVINAHGYNAGAQAYLTTYRWYGQFVADGGFPTLAADFGGKSTWGNDTALGAMSAAVTWWTSGGGPVPVKSDKVVLLGGSMGCLTVGLWAIANPSKVAAIVLVLPAIDLEDLHDNRYLTTPGDLAIPIEAAYGGSSGYLSALATKSLNLPAQRTALKNTGIPIQVHYSSNDPVAIPAVATDFATAVGADLHSVGALGHSAKGGLCVDVVRNFIWANR